MGSQSSDGHGVQGPDVESEQGTWLVYDGGKHCEAEMARQPALVRAVKTEMVSQECRVRVELIEISEFLERYPGVKSKTSKPTKESGKPKDGKGGKDKKEESVKVSGEPE